MPTVTKRSPRIRFEFVPARKQSTLGGLPALEALAQPFDFWKKTRALPGLDPRTRTSHGYSPELIAAQLLYCFCSGGASRPASRSSPTRLNWANACAINPTPTAPTARAGRAERVRVGEKADFDRPSDAECAMAGPP